MKLKQHIVSAALAAMTASVGAAPPEKQPHADSTEQAAPLYESAFADYRRYEEGEIAPWRELNDEVARLGGGHAHMRGAPVSDADGKRPPPAAPPDRGRMDHGELR